MVTRGSIKIPIHVPIVWPKPIASPACIGQKIVSGVILSNYAKNGEQWWDVNIPQRVLALCTILALNASLILDAFGAVLIVLA